MDEHDGRREDVDREVNSSASMAISPLAASSAARTYSNAFGRIAFRILASGTRSEHCDKQATIIKLSTRLDWHISIACGTGYFRKSYKLACIDPEQVTLSFPTKALMAPLDILIVGGGVAGSTLATLLLLLPVPIADLPHITIVERSAASRSHGQNIDIRGTGMDILRKLGLEESVRAATTGEEGVRIVDSSNRCWAEVAADKTGEVQTGTSDVEILRGRLVEILRKRSEEMSEQVEKRGGQGIEFIGKDWLSSLEQDGGKVRVVFANSGEERNYDLVVGADGLQSLTRKMVWGAKIEEGKIKRIGAYAGFFSMPKGETDSLWRRWYHAPGRRSIMVRPSDQPDRSTVLMIVVNEDDKRVTELAENGSRSVAGQKALLGEYFADAGWESERLITKMNRSDDFYFNLVAQVMLEKWSKGRVVLLGDAA